MDLEWSKNLIRNTEQNAKRFRIYEITCFFWTNAKRCFTKRYTMTYKRYGYKINSKTYFTRWSHTLVQEKEKRYDGITQFRLVWKSKSNQQLNSKWEIDKLYNNFWKKMNNNIYTNVDENNIYTDMDKTIRTHLHEKF